MMTISEYMTTSEYLGVLGKFPQYMPTKQQVSRGTRRRQLLKLKKLKEPPLTLKIPPPLTLNIPPIIGNPILSSEQIAIMSKVMATAGTSAMQFAESMQKAWTYPSFPLPEKPAKESFRELFGWSLSDAAVKTDEPPEEITLRCSMYYDPGKSGFVIKLYVTVGSTTTSVEQFIHRSQIAGLPAEPPKPKKKERIIVGKRNVLVEE
jgi:hypothetical protein